MLTVTRLKLSNICQYDEIDIPIETGLMAVCGRNGSGKSTLLRGLMYGLTGLVDGSWGTQANLQKDGCITPGYVVVTIKDDQTNKEYIIKRYSTAGTKFPDSVTEFHNGEYREVATRRKTVDAYLGELYGINCALLFQLCWGRQGQLDMLLTAPAAYVSTFLSGVWNTKYLETLRDRLKTSIDQIAVMADPMVDITNAAKEKLALEESLKGLIGLLDHLGKELSKFKAEKAELDAKANQNTLEDAKKVAIIMERICVCEKDIEFTLKELENRDLDAVKDKTEQELQEQLDVAQKAMEMHSMTSAKLACDISDRQDTAHLISSRIKFAQEELKRVKAEHDKVLALMQSDSDNCAFCGRKLKDKDAYIQNTMKVLGYYDEEGNTDTFSIKESNLIGEILKLKGSLEESNKDIADRQAERDKADDAVKEVSAQASELEQQLYTIRCLTKYAEAVDRRDALRADIAKYAKSEIDSDINANITRVTAAICELENRISANEKEKTATEARIQALTQYIDRLENEKEQYDVNCSARSMLVLLRDVFSQQRAQARYFASKAGELNEHLAAFLELTGMPFNLQLDPDTRLFSYTTEGGFEHPTAHLSGAQKNISAVALQMALVEVIRPNINLFLFDEPSESLDVENKIVMADLFRRMNRMLPSIGGTMLIVSRDEQLIDSCENVINIQQSTGEETNETGGS